MDHDGYITAWFAATRTVHFGSCLLVFGVCVFDRLVLASVGEQEQVAIGPRWRPAARMLLLLALSAALLSGASWLALVAIEMSGLSPGQAVHLDVLRLVWDQTQFGKLWQLRTILWLATAIAVILLVAVRWQSNWRKALTWVVVALGGLLAASLAWSGHGQTGGPVAWHLLADALHILVIGVWPIGLLPLILVLFAKRGVAAPNKWINISLLVRRFSAISLAGVAVLVATGLANSWFLVGSVSNLTATTYGRVLLIKIGLFCAIVAIGAVNLLRLKPRLSMGRVDENRDAAAARLRWNVLMELALASAILVVVGILGLLPPPAEPMHSMHHSEIRDMEVLGG